MDDFLLRSRMTLPVTTGTPGVPVQRQTQQNGAPAATPFRQMLERMAEEDKISFSKHAAGRIEHREIPLSRMA